MRKQFTIFLIVLGIFFIPFLINNVLAMPALECGSGSTATVILEDQDSSSIILSGNDKKGILVYCVNDDKFNYAFSGKAPIANDWYALVVGEDSLKHPETAIILSYPRSDGNTGDITINGSVELNRDLKNAKAWLVIGGDLFLLPHYDGFTGWSGWHPESYLFGDSLIDYHNIDVVPSCTASDWSCTNWSACSSNSVKTRTCNKISNCEGGAQSPATTQSCTYTPACSADTWQCGSWGTCSPQGVQTRSCSRTYDCPSVETAAPATSQYCESSYQQNYQTPSTDSNIVTNQDTIVKATVKLVCPVSSTMASQGSGTIINSSGLILTNKHVIDGTAGCWVGFIDDYDDEPYFGDRQIADIYKVSSDADVTVLKLRNPNNKILSSVNISQSNSSSIKLGEILTTYGYPAKFGTKITYTSGDFSGVDGDYLKTTAIIEHGNSGGGAYLKNGTFIGIPTAVVKGSLNSMGYLLSVNKVNSWLNNSVAYNYNNNNDYSRVSALLEDIDLNTLGSLGLFVAGDEANIKTETESQQIVNEEKSLITKVDNNLSRRVSGNILLQVEKNGEGWYVYPDNKKKYYLGRPADAFSIMRNLGLGIKHNELRNYLNSKFPSRLSGKIMLDVEQNGEAYYVNPNDLKGYYLNRPTDAFRIMRELGLGITNSDIRKIDVGKVE